MIVFFPQDHRCDRIPEQIERFAGDFPAHAADHMHADIPALHDQDLLTGRKQPVIGILQQFRTDMMTSFVRIQRKTAEVCIVALFPGGTGADPLTCLFRPESDDVASINRRLLPALLAQTDVLSATRGQSLEEAYLSNLG